MHTFLRHIAFGIALAVSIAAPALAQGDSVGMSVEIHDNQAMVDLGPMFLGQMLHVYADLAGFFIVLYLVLKIGSGTLRYPVLVLGLTFLATALLPSLFGHQYMWTVALVKSVGVILSLLWLLGILGLLGTPRPTEKTE